MEQSLSFEGDSGPYLQYAYARVQALLQKGKEEGIKPLLKRPGGDSARTTPANLMKNDWAYVCAPDDL